MGLQEVLESPTYPRLRDRVRTSPGLIGSSRYRAGETDRIEEYASGTQQRTIDLKSSRWNHYVDLKQKGYDIVADYGGPFYSAKQTLSEPSTMHASELNISKFNGTILGAVDGWLYPTYNLALQAQNLRNGKFPTAPGSDGFPHHELNSYGATGIKRSIPTIPDVSIAQTLGELKEGLPSLIGLKTLRDRTPRGMAGEYLNYQFGIRPLLSDIQGYYETAKNASRIQEQLKRDSGRLIRRRRTLLNDVSTTSKVTSNVYPYPANAYSFNRGTLTVTTKVHRVVWFSGAFKYEIDRKVFSLLDKLADFNRLYGFVPTPATAWELMPWSWLVDWVLPVGDSISNISYLGRDGLWMPWGYVMGHTITEETSTWIGRGFSGRYISTSVRSTFEVKQRLKAHPLGFGIKSEELTPSQLAILAALGISRLSAGK